MTHEQIREVIRMARERGDDTCDELCTIIDGLIPADLCGGEVVAWMYANKSTDDVSITPHRMSDLPFNRERWTETPLYAKPQKPAAEGIGAWACDVGEIAATIRASLYRAEPNMPSYPIGVVEPILRAALSPHSATPEVSGEELPYTCDACATGLYNRCECFPPTPAAIRAEATAQVVAWISNLSGDQFPTCTAREILDVVATSIERGDHLTGGGE